jgi:hypothetical protein
MLPQPPTLAAQISKEYRDFGVSAIPTQRPHASLVQLSISLNPNNVSSCLPKAIEAVQKYETQLQSVSFSGSLKFKFLMHRIMLKKMAKQLSWT